MRSRTTSAPRKFGQNQSLVTPSGRFGKPKYRNHFIDFSTDMRFRGGGRLGGGVDTGWSLRDNCFVVDSPQELVNCHLVTPFKGQTQLKLNGSLPLPKALRDRGDVAEPART